MFIKYFEKNNHGNKVIFIVEDNEIYAKLLQAFIQNRFPDISEIKIFLSGELCLTELQSNPCIVIVDYFLNSNNKAAENGIEIIKKIKELKPKTDIIVLSAQEKINVVIEAIKEYDCNYVQKDNESAFNNVGELLDEIFNREIPKVYF
jgi:ActR/RegA family two-component response regulator